MIKKNFVIKFLGLLLIIGGIFVAYHQYAWKTYINTRDGYLIKAPVSYYATINDNAEGLKYSNNSAGWVLGGLGSPGAKCHTISESIDIKVATIEQYNNGIVLNKKFDLYQSPDKTVSIDGLSAPWFTRDGGIHVGPVIHGEKAYTFSYTEPCDKVDDYRFPKHLDQFNKMLQSFEFTN